MALGSAEFEQRVRDTVWTIVTAEYETYQARTNSADGVYADHRPFWSSFAFEHVAVDGSGPSAELLVRFVDNGIRRGQYGFREKLWDVVAWFERFGTQAAAETAREDPERLAHELVFMIVHSIASAPSDVFDTDRGDDVFWLTGDLSWEGDTSDPAVPTD